MYWNIVWSVLAAIGILMGAMVTVCLPVFVVMFRRMKRTVNAGGRPQCPKPFCSFMNKAETTKSA